MDLETAYRWLVTYGYYSGQILLVIAAVAMVARKKGVVEILSLAGFVAFLVGTLVMAEAQRGLVHIGEFRLGPDADRQLWDIGRAVSSIGFLAGAFCLMVRLMVRR